MQPLSIRSGSISVRLSPKQCQVLADALWYAYRTHQSDNLGDGLLSQTRNWVDIQATASQENQDHDMDHWYTLGILFQACAVAGYAQQHLSPQGERKLDAQLTEENSSPEKKQKKK